MDNTIDRLSKSRVIAVVRGIGPEEAVRTAQALINGGLDCMEFTFAPSAPEKIEDNCRCIRAASEAFGKDICVGAGTVLDENAVRLACDAGARYIVSPDTNEKVIAETKRLGRVSVPGALTPTEIMTAYRAGADFIKLFPVSTLGTEYIRAIRAPLSHVRLLAVGGVDEDNAVSFLRAGCCGVGIGGNLVRKSWIRDGQFEKITETALKLRRAIDEWEAQA